MTTTKTLQRTAALFSLGAAAVHFGVTGRHFEQWWLYGVFFLLLASFQAGWALWAWTRDKDAIWQVGIVVNTATLVLWLVTRTAGLPFGTDPGRAEAFGTADNISSVQELLVVALSVAVLVRAGRAYILSPRAGLSAFAVVGALVLGTSGVALAAPAESHHAASADTAGHGAASAGAAGQDDMSMGNDAGAMPADSSHGERHSMSNLPDISGASATDTAKAKALLDATVANTAKYRDVSVAKAAGYDVDAAMKHWHAKHPAKPEGAPIRALHVPKKSLKSDDKVGDPTAPETLIYNRDTAGTLTLIGVMYAGATATSRTAVPPVLAGPYTRWHFHQKCLPAGANKTRPTKGTGVDGAKRARGEKETKPAADGSCPSGTAAKSGGYMMHVWLVSDANLRYAYAMTPPGAQLLAFRQSVLVAPSTLG